MQSLRSQMSNRTAEITTEELVCAGVRDRIRASGLWRVPGTKQESGRVHRISPRPFELSRGQVEQLERLGTALLRFYQAANELYLRSGIDWARDYLDLGKGEEIVRQGLMNHQKRALPGVIRPDVLLTDDGFAITELDSVPGGIGHLDCLSAAYSEAGFDLVGGARGMRDGFAAMIRDCASVLRREKHSEACSPSVCAIVVSEESADYFAEMDYLAGELRDAGLEVYAVRPGDVEFTEEGLSIETASGRKAAPKHMSGGRLSIDVVYRFFELFDLMNIPKAELIAYAAKKRRVVVTPPYKHFLEEKMLLALLHHEALRRFWESAMGKEDFDLVRATAAPTFILDNRPVPPHARIAGFEWRGEPIRDWNVIKDGTQKERRLVIKPSGFSELAWGSRGVKIGHDMSQDAWAAAVEEALMGFEKRPHVMQPFQDASIIGVRYFDEECGAIRDVPSRVRLCPYYFVIGGAAKLGGALATAVPQEKKLIHGMTEAVMVPCSVEKGS